MAIRQTKATTIIDCEAGDCLSLDIEKPQPLVAGAKVANRARWGEPIQADYSAGVNATPNRRPHHASRPE